MSYPSGRHLEPLRDGQRARVARMYYTSCPVCGALTDWSDTLPEARRKVKAHEQAHAQRAETWVSVTW